MLSHITLAFSMGYCVSHHLFEDNISNEHGRPAKCVHMFTKCVFFTTTYLLFLFFRTMACSPLLAFCDNPNIYGSSCQAKDRVLVKVLCCAPILCIQRKHVKA